MGYLKAVAAAIGAVATVLVQVLDDGSVTAGEWATIVVAVATAIAVFELPNET